MRKTNVIPLLALAASLALGAAARPGLVQSPSTGLAPDGQTRQLMEAGHALEKSGQKDEALADYTEAIDSHKLDRDAQARALFDRGLLLDKMERLDDALKDYGAALSLSPKFAAAFNNRANVYRRLRRFAEAERDYRASLAAGNPQSQYSYYGLGQVAEAQGKNEQARGFYTKALAADPDFVLASQKMAALTASEAAVHLHPPQTIARVQKGPQPVILKPPAPKTAPMRLGRVEAVPASYNRRSPSLKPALDQAGLGVQVQLGAWRSEAEAAQGWTRAVRQADGALDGYSPHIVAVDLPAGRYYRLRVATEKSESKGLCAALAAKGVTCIPTP